MATGQEPAVQAARTAGGRERELAQAFSSSTEVRGVTRLRRIALTVLVGVLFTLPTGGPHSSARLQ
jgi:hypothetical protein